MTDVPATNGVRTWIARLAEVSEVAGKISGGSLAVILLGLVIATYFGWITSPLAEIPTAVREHDSNMTRLLEDKGRREVEVLFTLNAMRTDMTRNSQAYRIRICSEIRDADVRKRCLES